LKKISGLSDQQVAKSKALIFSKITFINSLLISASIYLEAETLVADIDRDDTEHVALSLYLQSRLWSGDKKLHHGLRRKGISWILNTDELLELRLSSEEK